mgnify:CR=1 FL=1
MHGRRALDLLEKSSLRAPDARLLLGCILYKNGDTARALALHDLIAELTDGMFIESNPGPVKAALALSNLAGPEMRLPMVPVSAANRDRLAGILGRFASASAAFQEMR